MAMTEAEGHLVSTEEALAAYSSAVRLRDLHRTLIAPCKYLAEVTEDTELGADG